MKELCLRVGREGRQLLQAAAALARERPARVLTMLAATALVGLASWRWDPVLAAAARDRLSPAARRWAGHVRTWGAFNDTAAFVAVTWALGRIRHKPAWRRAALAALLAAAAAGIGVNSLRVTLGRPRPRAGLPDRFTGPSLKWNRQSFPSGHSGASFASATALAVAAPPVGGVALLSAGTVAAASVANRSHYLSDVLVGSGLGVMFGWLFGAAARSLSADLDNKHTVPSVEQIEARGASDELAEGPAGKDQR
ncbi:MAG: phosphatase PAP2 family protein [Kiritimatiellae bacterium]|nr:phosphatase PAP2 family protein [Kiritimatiellia bacterium]